mmetsp:Transcript_35718/g.63688  ORF Transcript_35718/g.63688 Transcript_35718/m.63688 type:complete len:231 (-) Transcript_35718:724-1416(-)
MFSSVALPEGEPQEWFCTVAFICTAYAMPRMAALWKPAPASSMNLRHIIFTLGASPVTPTVLFTTAPMVPATWLPWPLSSVTSPVSLTKLYPWMSSTKPLPSSSTPGRPKNSASFVHKLGCRSGWFITQPVSSTATTAPLPVVMSLPSVKSPRTVRTFHSSHQSASSGTTLLALPTAATTRASAAPFSRSSATRPVRSVGGALGTLLLLGLSSSGPNKLIRLIVCCALAL